MNTNLGYSKKTLTNTDVLLSGGGNKPLTDFIGSISWDATNRKLKYTPVGGSATEIVTFGSNALNSTEFLTSVHAGLLGIPPNTYKVTSVSAGIAPYISNVGTNIFAGATTSEITVERSIDNGSTWTDVTNTEATQIKKVFSGAIDGALYVSGNSTGVVGDSLRITFNPTNSTRYCRLAFIYIYFSSNGGVCTCTIEKNKYTEQSSWTTFVNGATIEGWSGPNIIGMGDTMFGLGDSRNNGYGLRFTFRISSVSGDSNRRGCILSLQGFTSNRAWGNPGNSIAKSNTPYTYLNEDRAVLFDNTITSSGFIKVGSSSSYVLLGNGGHKALSEFVGAISYDSNSKKLQYTPIGGNATDVVTFGSNAFNSTSYLPLSGGTLSGQLVSSLATGTAPISVASTTMCTNLNADTVDGKHASDFALSTHNHDGRYVQDYGSSITVALYDIPTKYIFSGSNVIDGPTTGWISGLVLGSNWNNNHYLHYLVESGSRWYATRSYDDNKMKDWNLFAYVTDNVASATRLSTDTTYTAWGQTFFSNGIPSTVSGNMTDVGSISASGNIAITKTSESAIFRATNDNVSIDLRVNTNANRGVHDSTTSTWIIATNGTYTVLNQGNVGIGIVPTEKLDVDGIILGTSVKAGAFGVNNTSKTSGKGISLYNGVTSGAPTNGIMFAGTDTFGTCGGVTYTWSTYFTVSNKTNIGWIFRRGSTNVASIDGNGSGYFSSSLTSSAVYTPSLEFKNVASGTGNGGYIDFHYEGASSYTSRIIESASGSIEASCTNFITNGTQFNLLSDESIINMRVPSSTSYVRALSYRGTTASNADLYVGNDFHDTRLTGRDVYIIADETTVMSIKHNSNSVGIGISSPSYKLEVNGNCGATNFVSTSDVRLKNIISYLVPDLDTIATAPGFLFKWKDQEKGTKTYAGTSALYWYDKFSYVVHKANDLIGTLAIQHDVLGVLCSISIARELKMLKEEVQEIKEYINNHLQ